MEHPTGCPGYQDMLLAIDPGADSGWAIFRDDALTDCGLGGVEYAAPGPLVNQVVIEHPVIYPGGRSANPNDIVKVAISAGEWAGRYFPCPVRYVKPRDWKGTIDADVCNKRVLAALSAEEGRVYARASEKVPARKRHNVIDAIGLGLFQLGRFGIR